MLDKRIRRKICHAIHRHSKANDNYMKSYDKNKLKIKIFNMMLTEKLEKYWPYHLV